MKKTKIFMATFLFATTIISCSTNRPSFSESNSSLIEQESNSYVENEESSSLSSSETDSTSSESDVSTDSSETTNEPQKYYNFKNPKKIYINPSVQYVNAYACNLGNEGEHMRNISIILTKLLKDNTNLIVYANNSYPGLSLANSVAESNRLDVDYHLALHSNAGGGKGSEGWHSALSKKFTSSILTSLDNVLPYTTRGLKNGTKYLYEIKNTTAKATLLEILFHDDCKQANFIVENYLKIATAIYEGIVSYFI